MIIRGVLGVVAGITTLSALLFAMEQIANAIAGGCVTAWIARHQPVRHAVAMGAIQALMTLAAMFSVRDAADGARAGAAE